MRTEITVDELTAALTGARPPLVLEALGEPYFRKGHLPGARRIDYLQAVPQVQAMAIAHDAPIVVYCASASCNNSGVAAHALRDAGYTDVRVYVEGKEGWQAAGRALTRDG
jgi:rhodanese-related sulfurtransferase